MLPSRLRLILFSCGALISTFALTSGARADLPDLVRRLEKEPSFIRYSPAAKKYVVETWPKDKLAAELELVAPDALENPYFKVVEGVSDQALPFTDFDGRNVLYHLMRAKRAYAAWSGVDAGHARGQTIVRVRMRQSYNSVTHFGERREANVSRYIHADYRGRWGAEIWFNRSRVAWNWTSFAIYCGAGVADAIITPVTAPLALLCLDEAIFDGADLAKIPAAIMHEAFHWATDEPLLFDRASEGHPLKEDLANYFGTTLDRNPRMLAVEGYADSDAIRDFSKVKPVGLEGLKRSYNTTNVLPAVLWEIRGRLSATDKLDQAIFALLDPRGPHAIRLDSDQLAFLAGLAESGDPELRVAVQAAVAAHRRGLTVVQALFRKVFEAYRATPP